MPAFHFSLTTPEQHRADIEAIWSSFDRRYTPKKPMGVSIDVVSFESGINEIPVGILDGEKQQ